MPPCRSAQECLPPAVMAVASVMPATCRGTEESPSVPLPNRPLPLWPQQDTVPARWSAQECSPFELMAVASVMPTTCLGTT